MPGPRILVLNAGSSSIKFGVFDEALTEVQSGAALEIGGASSFVEDGVSRDMTLADHDAALDAILAAVDLTQISGAAHRVVHGGRFTAPARINDKIRAAIVDVIPLAPLHNPVNLAPIDALSQRLPDLPQFASFDTAFHAGQPEVEARYALPPEAEALGLRRYGFHGLSYAGMVAQFGDALPKRLLAFHLGNGASACAILEGRSVGSSMGYSPLDGLTMGTRTGSIDGMAVLRLAQDFGIAETDKLLNKKSGLLGLAGTSDMRELTSREDEKARFAVSHFCHHAARHGGALATAMGGVDAVAFTGGIGENAGQIRDRIMDHLAWIGALPVHIIPAEEERQIARDAFGLMAE